MFVCKMPRFNLQHPGCNYTQVLFNQSEDGHDIVLYKLNQASAFRFCVSTEEASTELANAYVWTHTLKHVSLSPLMLTSLNDFF